MWPVAPVRPSTVTLPERPPDGVRTILDFFVVRFPRVSISTWVERFAAGKVWTADATLAAEDPFVAFAEVHYRREVEVEPPVRSDFRVVWSDDHLLVVDKPPNLPVTPGGRWVRGCLLHLLSEATENDAITPLHRLDRLTSGLVLLSLDPATRGEYSRLFQPTPLVEKTYTAVCEIEREFPAARFTLAHHIVRSPDEYWRQVVRPGQPANARCEVELLTENNGLVLLRVRPSTGRKHQLRVQLGAAGLPILGDPLYGSEPSDAPEEPPRRMWLDAHRLAIAGFPHSGGGDLTAEWFSSRHPAEFFRRALRSRKSAQDADN